MTAHTFKVGDKGMTRAGLSYEVKEVIPGECIRVSLSNSICDLYPDGAYSKGEETDYDLMPPDPPTDESIEGKPVSNETAFHKAVKAHLTKRQQGYVMDAFRKANQPDPPTDARDAIAGTSFEEMSFAQQAAATLGGLHEAAKGLGLAQPEPVKAGTSEPVTTWIDVGADDAYPQIFHYHGKLKHGRYHLVEPPSPELEQARVALAERVEGSSLFRSEYSMNHFICEHGPTILKALEK